MDGDRVSAFAHDVKACALGQASSSIMARNIVGASAAELREVRQTMLRMLKENGPAPEGPLCRSEVPRAGARLQGAACLDASDFRRGDRAASTRSRPADAEDAA
jgi:NifU-like protein involved in Fe-S cluster formation